jgi:hypothetical protein
VHCVDAAKKVDAANNEGISKLVMVATEHQLVPQQLASGQQPAIRSWTEIKSDPLVVLPFKQSDDLVIPLASESIA